MPVTCLNRADLRARPAALPCLFPATTRQPSPSCLSLSMNWALTESMPEIWMSRGGSSQERPYMLRTLIPMVCGVLCLKRLESGPHNGAPLQRAPVVLTHPLEAQHLLFRNVHSWE